MAKRANAPATMTPAPALATRNDARITTAYLAQLATDAGRRGAASTLRRIAAAIDAPSITAIPWMAMTAAHVRAIVARIASTPTHHGRPPAPATVAMALSIMKGCVRTGWEMECIDADRAARIRAIDAPRGTRTPTGRHIDDGETFAIIDVAASDRTAHGARDAAMMATAAGTGMRIAEIVGLTMANVTIGTDTITLRIIGKGNVERVNVLTNGQRGAVMDWLTVRGTAPGALFCRITTSGAVTLAHITTTAAYQAIQRRAQAANVDKLTVHDWRRTAAGNMLDANVDAITVARWLGHASPTTTMRYDRRGERAIDAAARTMHVPYRRRRRTAAPVVAQADDIR